MFLSTATRRLSSRAAATCAHTTTTAATSGAKVLPATTAPVCRSRALHASPVVQKGRPVYVVGVGMTKFEKPGRREWDYPDMVREAGTNALSDAGIDYTCVEEATIGYVFGESTSGNRAAYELGLTGIPLTNVNNNCSTGSTALYGAVRAVAGGLVECSMAIGFEKMQRGSLPLGSTDRESPTQRHLDVCADVYGQDVPEKMPPAPFLFAVAGLEHMERHGTPAEAFGRVAEKNHRHSVNNPYAQFQTEYTLEEIMATKQIAGPLTMLQCSPTSEGAAAAVICSEDYVRAHGLESTAVEIAAQSMTTDTACSFEGRSAIDCCGADMTRRAASAVYAASGLEANDVDVIELHDCFATNELITYEALGLCGEGEGAKLIQDGEVTYGGKWVVNPSGGLISKGHPLGATGLAQCAEMCWQIRGTAGGRQVEGARVGLQHNLGLGGAAVVTMYKQAQL